MDPFESGDEEFENDREEMESTDDEEDYDVTDEKEDSTEESTAFNEWEQKHQESMLARDQRENETAEKLREEGRAYMASSSQKRSERSETARKAMLDIEKDLKSTAATDGEDDRSVWAGAVGMLDVQMHADRRDTSRMRQVLFRLKNE